MLFHTLLKMTPTFIVFNKPLCLTIWSKKILKRNFMRYCLLYWTKVCEIQFKGKKNESWWMTNINWEISFIDEIKIQRRNSIFYGFYQPRATNIIEHFINRSVRGWDNSFSIHGNKNRDTLLLGKLLWESILFKDAHATKFVCTFTLLSHRLSGFQNQTVTRKVSCTERFLFYSSRIQSCHPCHFALFVYPPPCTILILFRLINQFFYRSSLNV